MCAVQFSTPEFLPDHRRRILLLDDSSRQRDRRVQQLIHRGFQVELVGSVSSARQALQRLRYDLVLVRVRRELERAADFCDELRSKDPSQVIGLLVLVNRRIPPTRHSDILWPEEDLPHLIARIEALAAFAKTA